MAFTDADAALEIRHYTFKKSRQAEFIVPTSLTFQIKFSAPQRPRRGEITEGGIL